MWKTCVNSRDFRLNDMEKTILELNYIMKSIILCRINSYFANIKRKCILQTRMIDLIYRIMNTGIDYPVSCELTHWPLGDVAVILKV